MATEYELIVERQRAEMEHALSRLMAFAKRVVDLDNSMASRGEYDEIVYDLACQARQELDGIGYAYGHDRVW
jgi:hypothetical protein